MDISTPKLVSDQTRTAIAKLLDQVVAEGKARTDGCVPDYKLCDDSSMALVRKVVNQTQFFVTDTGDTLPEGRIERSTNWVGFGNLAERFWPNLDPSDQALIEAALDDRDWPNIRW